MINGHLDATAVAGSLREAGVDADRVTLVLVIDMSNPGHAEYVGAYASKEVTEDVRDRMD